MTRAGMAVAVIMEASMVVTTSMAEKVFWETCLIFKAVSIISKQPELEKILAKIIQLKKT